MSPELYQALLNATLETLWMTFLSGSFATLVGLPLGIILVGTREHGLFPHAKIYKVLGTLINVTRSFPFIILLIALVPLTRLLVGTSIGTAAAIVPLTIGAIPFVARLVESALLEIPHGLIEAGSAMGASKWQIIRYILLPEARASLINCLTLTLVTLIGYSAMAGAVGGGGLGDLAIRYGYQRFNTTVMILTITLLIVIVQGIQLCGDRLAKKWRH